MNQNPIIKALREELEKERDEDALVYHDKVYTGKGKYVWSKTDPIADYKSGHEAASARLLSIVQKAVEMAEFYADDKSHKATVVRISTPVGQLHDISTEYKNDAGKKAREFLTTLADASGESEKDGK